MVDMAHVMSFHDTWGGAAMGAEQRAIQSLLYEAVLMTGL